MRRLSFLMVCGLALLSCSKRESAPENKAEATKGGAEEQVKRESEGEASEVEMTFEAQRRSGVVVAPAAKTRMTQHLQATGTVQPIDRSMAHVRPLARGRLLAARG